MKKAFALVVAMIAATPALAVDLPMPGLSLDTEVKMNHAVDAQKTLLTFNPEVNWQPIVDGPLTLSVGTTVTAYDSTAGDDIRSDIVLFDAFDVGNRPDIELGASWMLREEVELYVESGWDVDAGKRTEVNVGFALNF